MQVQLGNCKLIEESDLKDENAQIWKSQVLIPCPNSTHVYLGPFPKKADSDELKEIFPLYEKLSPIIFTEGPYDLSYIDARVFRSTPKVDIEAYINWLNKVEKKKGDF